MRVYLQHLHVHGICLSFKLLVGSVFAAKLPYESLFTTRTLHLSLFQIARWECICSPSVVGLRGLFPMARGDGGFRHAVAEGFKCTVFSILFPVKDVFGEVRGP